MLNFAIVEFDQGLYKCCNSFLTFNFLGQELLLHGRLSSRDILQRKSKGMALPSSSPALCSCLRWSTTNLQILHDNPFTALDNFRLQLQVSFFMDVIITMSWCIWMQHNDLSLKESNPVQFTVFTLQHFKKEFALVILSAKACRKSWMLEWLEA